METAIVAPFLVVLGLGIFEFSNFFYHRQLIVTGVHDAARYLARVEDPNNAVEQTNASELAVYGRIGGTVKRVPWWTVSDVVINPAVRTIANATDPSTGTSEYRGSNPIAIIRVSTNVDHPSLGFLTVLGIDSLIRVNVFHEERHIGD